MAIESRCQQCDKLLRVAEEYAGRQARCPECGYVYTVPNVNSGEPDPERPLAGPSDSNAESPENDAPLGADETPTDDSTTSGPLTQAPADHEQWYMKTPEGQIYGPADRQQLHQWVSEGRVTEDCQLRRGEHGAWNPAGEVFPQLKPAQPFQPTGGTYASGYARPSYGQPHRPTGGRYVQPHRGGLILTFAILGWAVSCPIFSVVAWAMGTGDVQQMRRGQMDNSGMGITQAGQILGMINTILWGFIVAFVFLIMICSAAAGAG